MVCDEGLEKFLGQQTITRYFLTELQGQITGFSAMTIQPTGNLEQYFDYSYIRFDSKTDGSKVYDVNIFRSKTTYQINKHLFLRAILQYDSYREVFLTDLLASFMLIPGTVVHVGYGSLHQNLGWENGEWTDPRETAMYYQTTQSLFLKASYLFQF